MVAQGNNVTSKEDERIAEYLKNRNLDQVNRSSPPVFPRDSFYSKYGKRALDLTITLPAVILLSPVYLTLCILNYLNLGKPIFYRQTRYGYHDTFFDMLKFRSMKNATDREGRQLPTEKRITKYGIFIRKYSLDELPNLFNIIKGDMSIIGPRAVPVFYEECMSDRHKMMSAVRPGLECPKMIPWPKNELMTDYQVTFENNIWYAENVSLKTDIKMFFKLTQVVLNMGERSAHAGALEYFVGYSDEGVALYPSLALKLYPEILDDKESSHD